MPTQQHDMVYRRVARPFSPCHVLVSAVLFALTALLTNFTVEYISVYFGYTWQWHRAINQSAVLWLFMMSTEQLYEAFRQTFNVPDEQHYSRISDVLSLAAITFLAVVPNLMLYMDTKSLPHTVSSIFLWEFTMMAVHYIGVERHCYAEVRDDGVVDLTVEERAIDV